MAEGEKPSIEELKKRVEDIEKAVTEYKSLLEERVRSRPLESVAMFLAGGVVLGILIGLAISRRQ